MTVGGVLRRDYSILLVDDDPEDAILLARALRDAGVSLGRALQIETVWNGLEALDLLGHLSDRRRLPDVVTLDLIMPVLDGVSVLKYLRATPTLAGLKAVVVTTSTERILHAEAMRAGADDVIVKAQDAAGIVGMAEHVLRHC